MSRPVAPALTVRYDGSQRTFAAGHDVVVGRDLRADVRIAHPLISRAHLVLRFDHDRWVAIDNGSLNGLFVNGRRMPAVDVNDGLAANIGNPDGPLLRFEVGHVTGSVGRPPESPVADRTTMLPTPAGPPPGSRQPPHISRPQPVYPSTSQPVQTPYPPSGRVQPPPPTAYPMSGTGVRPQPTATQRIDAGASGNRQRSHPDGADRDPAEARRVRRQPRDQHAQDLAAGALRRPADRFDQDRSRHRQRHRHPRRAGLAAPRHPGALGRRLRDRRNQSTTAASTARSSTASASTRRPCTTATSSPSATSTSSSPTAH